jgi:hypothetical protein
VRLVSMTGSFVPSLPPLSSTLSIHFAERKPRAMRGFWGVIIRYDTSVKSATRPNTSPRWGMRQVRYHTAWPGLLRARVSATACAHNVVHRSFSRSLVPDWLLVQLTLGGYGTYAWKTSAACGWPSLIFLICPLSTSFTMRDFPSACDKAVFYLTVRISIDSNVTEYNHSAVKVQGRAKGTRQWQDVIFLLCSKWQRIFYIFCVRVLPCSRH